MDAAAILRDLRARGFDLWPEGENIRIQPFDRLTDADKDTIVGSKPIILRLLRTGTAAKVLSPAPSMEPGSCYKPQPSSLLHEFKPLLAAARAGLLPADARIAPHPDAEDVNRAVLRMAESIANIDRFALARGPDAAAKRLTKAEAERVREIQRTLRTIPTHQR